VIALKPQYEDVSLLSAAYKARVPFTAHLTIGGDIAHFIRPRMAQRWAQHRTQTFACLTEIVRRMSGGGVYLNIGSAVTLPEVFSEVRDVGAQSRTRTKRHHDRKFRFHPIVSASHECRSSSGLQMELEKGFAITGIMSLTIPLLAAELICGAEGQ